MRIFAWLLTFAALPTWAATTVYVPEVGYSYAYFEIGHQGFSTQRGRMDKIAGNITLDMGNKQGTVNLTLDAASANTGWAKRDELLRSDAFFNVQRYPKLAFSGNQMKFVGSRPVSVRGTLTLLGVSQPVELTITQFHCGPHPVFKKEACGADAYTMIKRSRFGMTQFLPEISDDVKISVQIEATARR